MPILDDPSEIAGLLQRTKSVAIVGMSADPYRASNEIACYLRRNTDWTLWFVNPNETEILGQPAYATLADLPATPDIVDVFRNRSALPGVTAEAIDVGASALWFQLGLEDAQAAATASEAGLDVVQNRCIKVDHARLAPR